MKGKMASADGLSHFAVCVPLHVVTGTYVTRVYNLLGESSSSLRFLDSRTRILYGTFLQNTAWLFLISK